MNVSQGRFFSLLIAMLAISLASCANAFAAQILYESGTPGPTGVTWQQAIDGDVPGENVDPGSFTGARFQLTQSALVTRIGGHFVGPPASGNTLFGAIVALSNANDFPDSVDLSSTDVLASALLTFPEPSDVVFGNLNEVLNPGWYALVFGGGRFGATGSGGVLSNGIDIGDTNYIGYLSGFGWGTRLLSKRLVVEGVIVPEPSAIATTIFASLLLCGFKMTCRR